MKNSPTNPSKAPSKAATRAQDGPKPPSNLSREAKSWWRTLTGEWDLDESALLILQSALEAFDRMREAQQLIAKDGVVLVDRFQQRKMHPAWLIERDARASMLKALAALHLDLEPLQDGPGRPSGR